MNHWFEVLVKLSLFFRLKSSREVRIKNFKDFIGLSLKKNSTPTSGLDWSCTFHRSCTVPKGPLEIDRNPTLGLVELTGGSPYDEQARIVRKNHHWMYKGGQWPELPNPTACCASERKTWPTTQNYITENFYAIMKPSFRRRPDLWNNRFHLRGWGCPVVREPKRLWSPFLVSTKVKIL